MKHAGIEELKDIWFSEIMPLLNEYFYCDWEKLKRIIPNFVSSNPVPQLLKEECDEDNYYEFKTINDFSDDEFIIALTNSLKD